MLPDSVELVMDQTGCVGYVDGDLTDLSLLYKEICSQLRLTEHPCAIQ